MSLFWQCFWIGLYLATSLLNLWMLHEEFWRGEGTVPEWLGQIMISLLPLTTLVVLFIALPKLISRRRMLARYERELSR